MHNMRSLDTLLHIASTHVDPGKEASSVMASCMKAKMGTNWKPTRTIA